MTTEFPIITPSVIPMKGDQRFNERWLHSLLKADPSLLRLGDLVFRDSERPQPSGGRLDLLLSDPETAPPTWYEVEIQLGAIDESHIIRTIEYWDIERKRYPEFEHIAVIVAERVTGRFLNVIQLFNGKIPLIAIQLQLVEVNGSYTLIPSRIVDLVQLGTDEEAKGPTANRNHWARFSETLPVVDAMIARINDLVGNQDNRYEANYTLHYIAIMQNGAPKNFMEFRPNQERVLTSFKINLTEQTKDELRGAGLSVTKDDRNGFRIYLAPGDLEKYREHIDDLIRRAHEG